MHKILKLFSVEKVVFLGCDSWPIREFRMKFPNNITIYVGEKDYNHSALKFMIHRCEPQKCGEFLHTFLKNLAPYM
jgi:hypothetical protein